MIKKRNDIPYLTAYFQFLNIEINELEILTEYKSGFYLKATKIYQGFT